MLYLGGMARLTAPDKKDQGIPAGKRQKGKIFYSHRATHKMESAGDMIRSHDDVVEYYETYNDKREQMERFRKGKMWTEEELDIMRRKGKAPVVFNKIIGPIRTIMGTFINNRYDIKPAPFEPTDQDISDLLTQRYHYTAHHEMCRYKDPAMIETALVEGEAWQESYIDVNPGMKPRLVVKNQNSKAIYPDPNSTDMIDRSDCDFIDRDSWLTLGDLLEWFPEHSGALKAALEGYSTDGNAYEGKDDRSHETQIMRNGRFRVTERLYKVRKRMWTAVSPDAEDEVFIGEDQTGDLRESFIEDYPEHTMTSTVEEYLYLAVACKAWSNDEFLYNGEYHCQPRDPRTGRILFPLVQLYCESYSGESNGFVEFMKDPNRVINSMMANKLHASKHAVNTSLILDPANFTPDDMEDLEKHHSDGDRTFKTKPGVDPTNAVGLLPQGKSAPDTNSTLEYASMFQEEVSSAPPAARGVAEGNVPAALNEQRIQQAFTQLAGFAENLKLFLQKRAKLWYYYDREYFTEEETFRVMEKKNPEDEDYMTMNQWQMDALGNVMKVNDINAATYDIVFEDSWQSATVRDKVRQQIIQLQQNPGAANDPVLNAFLTLYFLKLTDAPEDLKQFVRQHSSAVQQQEAQRQSQGQQNQELQNASQMQQLAQTEAEQTALPPEDFEGSAPEAQAPLPMAQPL